MRILFFILLNTLAFLSNGDPGSGNSLKISFRHFVGEEPLVFKTKEYTNSIGQKFSVTKFKYYISNVQLTDDAGKTFESDEYFLVNEDELLSKEIILNNIPEGKYNKLSFILGVDSLHNCSGLQEGALDPVKGMFWAWNTGYIFLKLEGTADSSTAQGGIFEYHIGGYKAPANAIRNIDLNISNVNFSSGLSDPANLIIKTDVAEILQRPAAIDFSLLPVVSDFTNAEMIADNYCDMFSVIIEK